MIYKHGVRASCWNGLGFVGLGCRYINLCKEPQFGLFVFVTSGWKREASVAQRGTFN